MKNVLKRFTLVFLMFVVVFIISNILQIKPSYAENKLIKIECDGLRFRSHPWGDVLGSVVKGDLYKVCSSINDYNGNLWYKINVNGKYAYIFAGNGYTSKVKFNKNTIFKPRLTAPNKDSKFYSSDNDFYKYGYGMPNCTSYAWGRAYEILGQKPTWLQIVNAKKFYDSNSENFPFGRGNKIKVGSIICWGANDRNYYGHVAVVEKIDRDGKVTISESSWGESYFRTRIYNSVKELEKSYGDAFKGYIYLGDFNSKSNNYKEKVRVTEYTSVRKKIKGQNVGVLYRNSIVRVYDKVYNSNGIKWYKIKFKGKFAYINSLSTSKNLKAQKTYNIRTLYKLLVYNDASGKKIGTIDKNTVKTVYGYKKDVYGNIWYRISYGKKMGYINSKYISKRLNYNVRATRQLVVRNNPYGKIVGNLYKNTIKTVYGHKTDKYGKKWYKVYFKGKKRYIYANYTSRNLKFQVKTNYYLNVRKSPYGKIIDGVNKNIIKTVYGYKTDKKGEKWYKIINNGKYGYIHSAYTTLDIKKNKNFNVKINYDLNVRKIPWGEKIGLIYYGTIYKVYDQKRDKNEEIWYKISYKGNIGYIKAEFTTR